MSHTRIGASSALPRATAAFAARAELADRSVDTDPDGAWALLESALVALEGVAASVEHEAARVAVPLGPIVGGFRESVFPWLMRGPLNDWAYRKPYGQPGDVRMLDMILRGEASPTGISGLLDRYFLELAFVRAIVHRRRFALELLREFVVRRSAGRSEPLCIVSVGCGPAAEIEDAVALPEFAGVHFVLLDGEQDALDLAHARIRARNPQARVTTHREGLYRHQWCGQRDLLDLLGRPADAICSVGSLDFVPDSHFGEFAALFRRSLAPGGMCLLGHFDSYNPSRIYMEWVLDWHPVYRSHDQVEALVERHAAPCRVMPRHSVPGGISNFTCFVAQ